MTAFPQLNGFRGGNGIVRVIGHRGARGLLPENTMLGFDFTLAIGVRALEFDVVLTRDGVPVITHNHRLSPAATRDAQGQWLTGDGPRVSSLTVDELQALDVGGLDGRSTYGQRFPDQAFLNGVHVPRLTDLLDRAAQPDQSDLYLLLELKSDPAASEEIRNRLVNAVVDDVRSRGLNARTILHSFDWALLDLCRDMAPDMPTSYLSELPQNADAPGEDSSKSVGPDYAALSGSVPQAVKAAGGQMWCPYFQDVTPALVAEAHALGLLVTTWTVNEPSDIDAMLDAGVDGIVSDYPGRVQRKLLDRNLRWN